MCENGTFLRLYYFSFIIKRTFYLDNRSSSDGKKNAESAGRGILLENPIEYLSITINFCEISH